MWILGILGLFALAVGLLYHGRTVLAWAAPIGLGLVWWATAGGAGSGAFSGALALYGVLVVFLAVPLVRRQVVTPIIMRAIAPVLPRMSETERIALEAGTTWWDADLFSGRPDWKKWLSFAPPKLSEREQAFLDGPVEELCAMTSDWESTEAGDLSKEAWDHIKANRYFGMIIPESYGGLGFSALANSSVVTKCASRSTALAVTVMVPNSLGPAELLLHYGTEEQKSHYLPRLAKAEEIPCFALTEPAAGSDAGGMRSTGVVCRGEWKGEDVLGIRLDWSKRYITLAPIATVLGLAFRLLDPDHLLGDVEDLGITCALIPADLPGIDIGKRHDPLGVVFMNGPTTGADVFVPVDSIIGGPKMAGKGWMMLMQCLSAGRGISLPSLAAGSAQLSTRTVGAYATIREQFGLPLGRFEGVQEAIARIAGATYLTDAVRVVTAASIDAGEKPSVISAIAKCYSTEQMRQSLNDSMDVLGGSGISLGPRNVMARGYVQAPIGITVEGANILTRTMIVFGQGALRCHPFARHEVAAVAAKDVGAFDENFFGHVGFVFQNLARTFVLAVTNARFADRPNDGPLSWVYPQLTRYASAFTLAADFAMGTLGGELKRREQITGRLADVFAWLYIASAALKKFEDEGRQDEHLPYAEWVCRQALYEIEDALSRFIQNLPSRPAAWKLRVNAFPLGRRHAPPSDRLCRKLAAGVLEDAPARRSLTRAIFIPPGTEPGLGHLEATLERVMAARTIQTTVKKAVRARRLAPRPVETLYDRALEAGVIGEREHALASEAEALRAEAIEVDAFAAIGRPSKAKPPPKPAREPAGRAR